MRETMEEEKIIKIMHDNITGLSITEIVKLTALTRSSVRTSLARLEGANKVKSRKIGMAKVYILNHNISETNQIMEHNTAYDPQFTSLIQLKNHSSGGQKTR